MRHNRHGAADRHILGADAELEEFQLRVGRRPHLARTARPRPVVGVRQHGHRASDVHAKAVGGREIGNSVRLCQPLCLLIGVRFHIDAAADRDAATFRSERKIGHRQGLARPVGVHGHRIHGDVATIVRLSNCVILTIALADAP